jgi:putative ABC transport system permease protein
MPGELRRFSARVLAMFRSRSLAQDLQQELVSHMGMLEEDLQRRGLTEEDARRQARLKVGGVTQLHESHREMRGLAFVDAFMRDVRGGVRGVIKNPGFAAVVLVTLALGIGANTAMFSMIHGVLLRPLGYHEPDQLVSIARGELGGTQNRGVSLRRFDAIHAGAKSLTSVGAYLSAIEDVLVSGTGDPEVLKAARVSANFLEVLGTRPEVGRSFLPEEDTIGGPPVAMVSAALWRRRFGASGTLSGTTVTLNSRAFTIVGVLPESFRFPFPTVDVWFPQPSQMSSLPPQFRACCAPLRLFARLTPGVSIDQARAELRVLSDRDAAANPRGLDAGPLQAAPLKDELTASVNTMLWVLLAAVGFVLLIGCANVAVLLMARATSRSRELAVRAALGASRGQLLRQLVAESLVLAIGGGLLGVLLAHVVLSAVRQMAIFDLPRVDEIAVDAVVLGFAAALSLAAGVVFGTLPSLQVLRSDLMYKLRQSGANDSGSLVKPGTSAVSARAALVVAQVALSIVLLIGAGLMIRTLTHLASVDPGFRPDGLVTMRVPLPVTGYATPGKRSMFFDELVQRVGSIPGVRGAAVMRSLPTTPGVLNTNLQIEEQPIPAPGHLGIRVQTITPGYFQVLGILLKRGRDITPHDNAQGSAPVVIINESFARRFWPGYPNGPDPIGKRISVPILQPSVLEIVGITGDVREEGLTREAISQFYIPSVHYPPQTAYLAARAEVDPSLVVRAIRAAVQEIDRDQSVGDIRTMTEILEVAEGQRRLAARLLSLFAGTALLLAVVGIYGVVAYSVAQRTSEIGIRRALGAESRDIVALVLGHTLRLAVIGVACGVSAAVALTRVMQSLLFEVSTTDVPVFGGVAALFIVIALVSGVVPAWRAIRINPLIALRA